DGRWLAVGAIEPVFWANLCKALDLERWIPHQSDDAVQEDIRRDLRAAFATRDRDDWVAALADADTCVAPVLAVDEVPHHPQFAARGAFVEAEHPVHGRFRQLGPVLAGMPRPQEPVRVPDASRTDTEELLAAAGVPGEEIAKLRAEGVVA
ncbi:MAG: CoA transferase, partial [Myxococcota bacterium]|nr:CoA transferase [Myxococcota bacterium]